MTDFHGCEVSVLEGDITDQSTEAIVNAANPSLLGGDGVDGAIHARAGPSLLRECQEIRRTTWPEGLPTGRAVLTHGGQLPARFVIHTVGPVWRGGNEGEAQALRDAYTSCLETAEEHGIRSIAFPAISTGAFGYPVRAAARVAAQSVLDFLERSGSPEKRLVGARLSKVRFVLFSERVRIEFETALKETLAIRGSRS